MDCYKTYIKNLVSETKNVDVFKYLLKLSESEESDIVYRIYIYAEQEI